MRFVIRTDFFPPVLLIRAMVGLTFISEGLQKLIFPMTRGQGRFMQLGLPSPEFLGHFVGSVEILCGIFVLVGFATRMSTLPLITIMATAIVATKLPVLFDSGFWEMAHLARVEFAMLMGCFFLLITGSSEWSVDDRLQRIRKRKRVLSKSLF